MGQWNTHVHSISLEIVRHVGDEVGPVSYIQPQIVEEFQSSL